MIQLKVLDTQDSFQKSKKLFLWWNSGGPGNAGSPWVSVGGHDIDTERSRVPASPSFPRSFHRFSCLTLLFFLALDLVEAGIRTCCHIWLYVNSLDLKADLHVFLTAFFLIALPTQPDPNLLYVSERCADLNPKSQKFPGWDWSHDPNEVNQLFILSSVF